MKNAQIFNGRNFDAIALYAYSGWVDLVADTSRLPSWSHSPNFQTGSTDIYCLGNHH
jgi:hypothetical protein